MNVQIHKNDSNSFVLNQGFTDFLRFLSCMIIAMHHYSCYVFYHGFSFNIVYKMLASQGGFLGVAIFFFLSGYGLMMSESKQHLTFLQFINKRFLKICIPVLLITAMWIPFYVHFKLSNLQQILYLLFWNFGDPVLWYFKALLLLYISFDVFSTILRKSEYTSLLIFLLLILLNYYITKKYIYCNGAISIPCFALGVLSAKYRDALYKMLHSKLMLLLFLMCFISSFVFFRENFALHCIINYICVFSLLFIGAYWDIIINNVGYLGKISFDIYLVHGKVLCFFKYCLPFVSLSLFLLTTIIFSFFYNKLRRHLKLYC